MKIDPDQLAQHIRKVDGNNHLGAGLLAEKICEWFESFGHTEPVISGWLLENIESKVIDLDPESESCVSNADVLELVQAVRTLQSRQALLL